MLNDDHWFVSATHDSGLMGSKPTGNAYDAPGMVPSRLEDGMFVGNTTSALRLTS